MQRKCGPSAPSAYVSRSPPRWFRELFAVSIMLRRRSARGHDLQACRRRRPSHLSTTGSRAAGMAAMIDRSATVALLVIGYNAIGIELACQRCVAHATLWPHRPRPALQPLVVVILMRLHIWHLVDCSFRGRCAGRMRHKLDKLCLDALGGSASTPPCTVLLLSLTAGAADVRCWEWRHRKKGVDGCYWAA